MKKTILIALLVLINLSSCVTSYYQVYDTETENVIFQDENCSVSYSLWADNGNPGFAFYNNADENLYIDLNESFFVINGWAKDYYDSEVHNGKRIIVIPPKTRKLIMRYVINNSYINDCDLPKYPSRKKVTSVEYTKAASPIVFSNTISYKKKSSETLTVLNHEFYVKSITNYPAGEFYGSRKAVVCGEKQGYIVRYFAKEAPGKFYLEYSTGVTTHRTAK